MGDFGTALSGLRAATSMLSTASNNLAIAPATGSKASTCNFVAAYASGGANSTAIGTGVTLAATTQQFTPGNIKKTDVPLNMAIVNGDGFFVLNNGGSQLFTRAGDFFRDSNGNIANSQGQQLIGYLVDPTSGNITTSKTGPLVIQNTNSNPVSTATVTAAIDFNSTAQPPVAAFPRGFSSASPPSSASYNETTTVQIYDSLGNVHDMTMYYVKQPAAGVWSVYVGIDGADATPQAVAPPGGTPAAPGIYPSGGLAKPYTIVFDTDGNYVVNNPVQPPMYYGPQPVFSAPNVQDLSTTAGTLPVLANGDLIINDVNITMGTTPSDTTQSKTDNAASAISLVTAINNFTNSNKAGTAPAHKVIASTTGTTVQFTGGNYLGDTLGTGDLTINDIKIEGTPVAGAAGLAAFINGLTATEGITATTYNDINGVAQLQLFAVDGRNIEVSTTGSTTSLNFANFATHGGLPLDKVMRGQISLTIPGDPNQGITIGGTNPGFANLTAGHQAGIYQPNSDAISLSYTPAGAKPQTISINLGESTQVNQPFAVTARTQDGYPTGRLTSVEVNATGVITAQFSNQRAQPLGQVALAYFPNRQGLQAVGGTAWAQSSISGAAVLSTPGSSSLGSIQSGALEDSNVDVTQQLVNLILAQRTFQASAQSIKTIDAITQTMINIK